MSLSRAIRTLGLVPVLILALVAPVAADHDGTTRKDAPTFRTERTYVKCTNGDKVQTVSMINGQWPRWSTTPPPGSVQAGHGCGHYENTLTLTTGEPNFYDLVWTGTFTGNVERLTVEAHNIYAGSPRATRSFALAISLFVDGEKVYGSTAAQYIVPVTSSTGASEKIAFTLAGLSKLGFGSEHGNGEVEREYTLVMSSYNEYQSAWVWDTTEVPSGVIFNPAAAEPKVITIA